jgi:hypothetical protein
LIVQNVLAAALVTALAAYADGQPERPIFQTVLERTEILQLDHEWEDTLVREVQGIYSMMRDVRHLAYPEDGSLLWIRVIEEQEVQGVFLSEYPADSWVSVGATPSKVWIAVTSKHLLK